MSKERERRPLFIANWKMHKTVSQTRAYIGEMLSILPKAPVAEIVLAPPFTSLPIASELIRGSALRLAAQDLHWEPAGAWTGEISAEMLTELSVGYVLVGHSERRGHFGDTDDRIARKVRAVQDAGMIPVLCVGENQDERDSGRTDPVIEAQLRRGLSMLRLGESANMVLAYEPVWAIGTGRTASVEQAASAHRFLRRMLGSAVGEEVARSTPILYGGSVNLASIPAIAACEEVDGCLVGGASLEAAPFLRLVLKGSGEPCEAGS